MRLSGDEQGNLLSFPSCYRTNPFRKARGLNVGSVEKADKETFIRFPSRRHTRTSDNQNFVVRWNERDRQIINNKPCEEQYLIP